MHDKRLNPGSTITGQEHRLVPIRATLIDALRRTWVTGAKKGCAMGNVAQYHWAMIRRVLSAYAWQCRYRARTHNNRSLARNGRECTDVAAGFRDHDASMWLLHTRADLICGRVRNDGHGNVTPRFATP